MIKRFLFALISITLLPAGSPAQSLPAGAVAFIGLQGAPLPIAFAVVLLQDIGPGTQISFTDNKWGGNRLLTNEGTIVWTSPDTTVPAGTILRFKNDGPPTMSLNGPGSVSGRIFHFFGLGDQILAYTGSPANPSFIAGISNSNWKAECDTFGFQEFRTCLPPPLVNGFTAIAFVNATNYNIDNGYFSVTPLYSVGPEMLPIINNVNYWYLSNGSDAGYNNWPDWDSGNTLPFASTIEFEQESLTLSEGGPAGIATLTISAPQFAPQIVGLTILHFGNASPADYTTTPSSSGQSLSLEIPANSTSYSFNIQALIDGIAEPDENITFLITSLSGGLVKGNKDALMVVIKNTDNENLSTIQFAADTVHIMEGAGPRTILLEINPPTPAPFFIVLNAHNGPGIQTDYFTTPALANGQIILGPTGANTSSINFTVNTYDDFQLEADEYVSFTIAFITPEGILIGNRGSMTLVIQDNDAIPAYIPPLILINEFAVFNSSHPDEFGETDSWIELYNADTLNVNLSGYHITNDFSVPTRFTFPNLSSQLTMPPKSYMVLWADQQTFQGARHLNFTLTENSGFIGLYAPDGEMLIDGVSYPPQRDGFTYGRIPNGNDNWKVLRIPTPGATNTDSIPTAVLTPGKETRGISGWPNPATGLLNLAKAGTAWNGNVSIEVIDIAGRRIETRADTVIPGKSWTVDVSSFPGGHYFVVLSHKSEHIRVPFVKTP